jgi:cobalt-zinc-cadmium efflux system protein
MEKKKEAHRHEHGFQARGRLIFAIVANSLFMVVEVVFGLIAGSLALLGDAGHNFTDSLALVLSLVAVILMERSRDHKKTFGYHRTGILVAFINSLVIMLVCAYLFYEAIGRLADPPEVKGGLVILIAGIGFLINGGVALMLARGREDLNIRSAFLHLLADALVSLGVVASGIIIVVTGWWVLDPIISMLIGLVILAGAFRIMGESVNILMEAVPRGLSYQDILSDMGDFSGVNDVHDLHIWEIGSNIYALSAHVAMDSDSVEECQGILHEMKGMLKERYGMAHSTLEVEGGSCLPGACRFEGEHGPSDHRH